MHREHTVWSSLRKGGFFDMGRSLSLIRQSGLEQRRAPYCLRAAPDDRLLLLALSCFVLILASSAYFWSINGAIAVTNCSNPDQDVGSCTCCHRVRALLPTCTTPQEEQTNTSSSSRGNTRRNRPSCGILQSVLMVLGAVAPLSRSTFDFSKRL